MNEQLVLLLKTKAQQVAETFSNPDREKNTNQEKFTLIETNQLSETTAYGIYMKEPTNKLAIVFFYYLNMKGGVWYYFFPTESHAIGMRRFEEKLVSIDKNNFDLN